MCRQKILRRLCIPLTDAHDTRRVGERKHLRPARNLCNETGLYPPKFQNIRQHERKSRIDELCRCVGGACLLTVRQHIVEQPAHFLLGVI